jgi:hypothetical protein
MNIYFIRIISLVFLVLWLTMKRELTDMMMIAVFAAISLLLLFKIAIDRERNKLIWTLSAFLIILFYALLARTLLIREVDQYAENFISKATCIPSQEILRGEGWLNISKTAMVKEFRVYLFNRSINLQDNGYFRYGYMDGKRFHQFKPCK